MRILRDHDPDIEKHAGYACMRCLSYHHYGKDARSRIAETYKSIFANFAWPGGYTVIFITDDGDILCADCAKRYFIIEKQDITCGTYDEGPTLYCDHCNREIESSYGDPDGPQD